MAATAKLNVGPLQFELPISNAERAAFYDEYMKYGLITPEDAVALELKWQDAWKDVRCQLVPRKT